MKFCLFYSSVTYVEGSCLLRFSWRFQGLDRGNTNTTQFWRRDKTFKTLKIQISTDWESLSFFCKAEYSENLHKKFPVQADFVLI